MSLTKKIAHNTIIQIVGKIASTLLGLVAIGMMTRYLGQEQFGWYTTTITFLQFTAILLDFGLIPVTAQMLGEGRFEKQRLLRNLLGLRFTTAVIGFGIAPLIALLFSYPTEVKIAIAFSTISFLAIAMNQIFTGFYQEKLKTGIQVAGDILSRIVLVAGLFLATRSGASFITIMIIVGLANVIYTAFLWIKSRKDITLTFAFESEVWKVIVSKMWPIAISIIFNVIYLRGDILILTFLRSQAEVGIYGAAYRVLDIVGQIAMLMMGIFLPLLAAAWASGKKELLAERYGQAFSALMLLGVPITVGTFILAEPIMVLVAGAEFAESGALLKILSLAIFGVYLGAIYGHLAVAMDKQKSTIWIYISTAVLTLAGYFYFIPRYGLVGAAWMSVFSELYAGILLTWVIGRHTKNTPIKLFLKILFSVVVMATFLFFGQNFLPLIFLIIIGALLYAGILYITKGISRETIKEILSR